MALGAPEFYAFIERDTTIKARGKIILFPDIDFQAVSLHLTV
jgi:hypothetical protein